MTDPAVAGVVRGYRAWNELDLDTYADRLWTEDIEGREDPTFIDAGVYRGRREMKRWMEAMAAAFGDMRLLPEEVIVRGDELFVALRLEGEGPTSGAPVTSRVFHVLALRDRRICRFANFLDRGRALEAMGLPPDARGVSVEAPAADP